MTHGGHYTNGLKQSKDVRDFITSKYEYILIDEFQDTNPLQYHLLESFYDNCHLFCVGDDAQSIYAFRGADFKSIHNFTKTVPNSEKLYLNINYRSTQEILDISNWLLKQSPIEYGKNLKAHRGAGLKPTIEYVYDNYAEANSITDKILAYYLEKNINYSGHIVLSRSMSGLRHVEGSCIIRKIPYVLVGGSKLLKSKHIRDVISIMRVLTNYKDELAWYRYLQLWETIGTVKASKITDIVVDTSNLENAINKLKSEINNRLITDVLEQSFEYKNSPSDMIEKILVLMDKRFNEIYKEEWIQWRKQDFEVLKAMTKNMTSVGDFITEYILDPSLESLFNNGEKPKDLVTLSTIHSAKGLEADVCHIVNVSPYSYPSKQAITDGEDSIEEERRCLYVALTRAKNELILYSRHLSAVGSGMANSHDFSHYFLNELPKDSYVIIERQIENNHKTYNGKPVSVDINLF